MSNRTQLLETIAAQDEELLTNYPELTPTDLKAAWDYYQQNRESSDRAIAEDE